MTGHSAAFKKTKTSKIVLLLSIFISVYWIFGQVMDIYSNAGVGAIFEILWFPAMAATVILPIVSVINLFKEKFSLRSLYLYSILTQLIALLTIILITGSWI